MARLQDWPQRFRAKLREIRTRPFDYDQSNCALTAAEVAEAITGKPWVDEFRALDYRGQIELLAAGGGLEGVMAQKAGPPIPAAQAHRGDVAVVKTPIGKALAVFDPPYLWGAGLDGLQRLTMDSVLVAFKVD